jgi:glutamate synthase (NADPH/NADH) small chain
MAEPARVPPAPALPSHRPEHRLPDAKPLYAPAEAVAEANRCLYCHDAPCVTACPTGIDIPAFIRKISTGNVRGSARAILSANLLGYSCARVCPVEVLCVGACVYNAWHRSPPIAIGRLQRFATEAVMRSGGGASLFTRAPANGRRVACVGAGPASLACAGYLALEGTHVTVFERRPLSGGLNTTGVAPYKMHAESSLEEVSFILSLGVEVRTGVAVGRDVGFDRLLAEYDAVFIGAGLGTDARLGVPGEDGPGVTGAVAWIERMKLEPGFEPSGVRAAVVVGGGNTAIDSARELARLGVPSVQMLYRRTAAEMSGYVHELAQARHEGVVLVERAVPEAFERGPDGRLAGVRLADGRTFACDLALVAIGQARLATLVAAVPGVGVDARGRVVVDRDTGCTGHPKVYAGGDAVSGGELVVTAVQEGKRAARGICAALGIAVRADAPLGAGHR